MRALGGVAVLLVAVTAVGCGGKPEGCVTISEDVAQAVVNGSTGDLKLQPASGRAIRADSGVIYAAYRITAAGSDEVGVWALDGFDPPGAIWAVDGYAQQFTKWPVLDAANGSRNADNAKACLDD